jgi:hypothetical protein
MAQHGPKDLSKSYINIRKKERNLMNGQQLVIKTYAKHCTQKARKHHNN